MGFFRLRTYFDIRESILIPFNGWQCLSFANADRGWTRGLRQTSEEDYESNPTRRSRAILGKKAAQRTAANCLCGFMRLRSVGPNSLFLKIIAVTGIANVDLRVGG